MQRTKKREPVAGSLRRFDCIEPRETLGGGLFGRSALAALSL